MQVASLILEMQCDCVHFIAIQSLFFQTTLFSSSMSSPVSMARSFPLPPQPRPNFLCTGALGPELSLESRHSGPSFVPLDGASQVSSLRLMEFLQEHLLDDVILVG